MNYIQLIGGGCLGIVIAWLVRYFIQRFDEFTPRALTSVVSVVAGGAVLLFLQTEQSVLLVYPIGLVLGFMFYPLSRLPLDLRPDKTVHGPSPDSHGPDSLSLDESVGNQEPITTKDIRDMLKDARRKCTLQDYEGADEILKKLEATHPQDFDVLKAQFYLYVDPKCKLMTAEEIGKFILKKRKLFDDNPEYHRLVAFVYMEMRDEAKIKGAVSHFSIREKAIEAANKAIELDNGNPRWHRLLGYTHYWFGGIEEAIEITESALKMAKDKGLAEEIVSCKNNLAFYYATTRNKEYEERARKYSEEVCGNREDAIMYLDTLAYVKWKFARDDKELEEAASIFEMALKKNPFDANVSRHLTECLQELKWNELRKSADA